MLFAVAACELAARVVFPAPPNPTRQPQIVYQFDPGIRYVLLPNQRGWIDDGFVTTNSLGFRGRELVSPKPRGQFRMVAIGDSLTFGWGVNDNDTFCAQLEQLLRRRFPASDVDVVNLGVGGYDTHQEVALLKRNVARLQPDMVLVGFYSNDVPEAFDDQETAQAAETGDVSPTGRILHLNPAPLSFFDAQMRRSRAIFAVGRVVKRLSHTGEWARSGFSMELDLLKGQDSAELNIAWDRITRHLAELRKMATAGHFAVGIVALPPREQVMGVYGNAHYQTRLRAIAEQFGFLVIDPLPALAARASDADALFIPYDRNHPSAAGHRVLANAIFDSLEQHDAVKPTAQRVAGQGSEW